nr:MAG TPA_asm: hypothetical protein [Caudoviricetes sp.]
MGCTPKIDGGGKADFAEQSADGRINAEIYAVGAKPRSQRHSRNGFPKRSEENSHNRLSHNQL